MQRTAMWSNITAAPFLLTGFPGLEIFHPWISIAFFIIYVSILLGNGTLLFLIREDYTLHEPMYYFLAILAATDLGVTLTTMPTVLAVLWLDHREISHEACYFQAYLIHSFSIVESGVLLIMAYDRFIAICNPLRYTSILTTAKKNGLYNANMAGIKRPGIPVIQNTYSHCSDSQPLTTFTSAMTSTLVLMLCAAPFLLTGFPGLEAVHHWISIPFFAVYVSVLLGNGTLLYLVKNDHSLHEPMYYFLAMLAGTDLMATLTTMPTVMGILWVNHRKISHGACFLQAYFIHSLSSVESGLETVHHWISIPFFAVYVSVLLGNGTLLYLIKDDHSLHEPMYYFLAMLAGTDLMVTLTTMPTVMGVLWVNHREMSHGACFLQAYFIHSLSIVESGVLLAMAYDRFIAIRTPLRYNSILTKSRVMKTVMGIASAKEQAKAFNTCVSHISCVLVFYITVIGLTFIHRFGKHAPHVVHITMSYVYFLFPPFMNPIIYSIKSKQIQLSIVHLFSVHNRA
ncbi:Olfactory receptor 51B2 [Pteropus alecto]|uniref:Olfactory receptor 51B2 n=1 Tax=Pteropus alecto TaxID=9402 RepID=L5KG12_PTEAL|nr:Olfactory receptor 51B2 [Pteropus alecto]